MREDVIPPEPAAAGPAFHLLRPAAGCKKFEELHERLRSRPVEGRQWFISTRRVPRRLQPPIPGTSVYWIIDRAIQARAAIEGIREVPAEDGGGCLILLTPELHAVRPIAHKPFQGWRYLAAHLAPADLGTRSAAGAASLPVGLRRELGRLGLL